MRKYLLKRIALSLVSLFIVVFIVMFLIYKVIDKESIFIHDEMYTKLSGNSREIYRYNRLQKYDYIKWTDFNDFLKEKYDNDSENPEFKEAVDSLTTKDLYDYFKGLKDEEKFESVSSTRDTLDLNPTYFDVLTNPNVKEFYEKYHKKNYSVYYMIPVYSVLGRRSGRVIDEGKLIAVYENNTFQRMGLFISKLFHFETINDVEDESLTNRYIRWEWDPYSNMPALIGSGTRHKYLIYFDRRFPFVHQNIFSVNLGTSNIVREGYEFSEILSQPTGRPVSVEQVVPANLENGTLTQTQSDFHTVTYSPNINDQIALTYGEGEHYINASNFMDGYTRIGNSFIIGIISTILAYFIGIPIGIIMSRKKGKIFDKLGMGLIIFISAVPTLAYIYMFAGIGTQLFKLPYNWSLATIPILAFILPTFSLMMPQLVGQMKWTRRFMIDQQNSDYVKFAKSQGLSEREIFSKHIFRNAFIYLIHGVPGAIITSLTGAIITERVYSVPGVGGLLTNAINAYDNTLIVAVTIFYTFLSILSLILGDLLLSKYDPRVSFTNSKG